MKRKAASTGERKQGQSAKGAKFFRVAFLPSDLQCAVFRFLHFRFVLTHLSLVSAAWNRLLQSRREHCFCSNLIGEFLHGDESIFLRDDAPFLKRLVGHFPTLERKITGIQYGLRSARSTMPLLQKVENIDDVRILGDLSQAHSVECKILEVNPSKVIWLWQQLQMGKLSAESKIYELQVRGFNRRSVLDESFLMALMYVLKSFGVKRLLLGAFKRDAQWNAPLAKEIAFVPSLLTLEVFEGQVESWFLALFPNLKEVLGEGVVLAAFPQVCPVVERITVTSDDEMETFWFVNRPEVQALSIPAAVCMVPLLTQVPSSVPKLS